MGQLLDSSSQLASLRALCGNELTDEACGEKDAAEDEAGFE